MGMDGERAGLTVEQLIQILNDSLSVERLLESGIKRKLPDSVVDLVPARQGGTHYKSGVGSALLACCQLRYYSAHLGNLRPQTTKFRRVVPSGRRVDGFERRAVSPEPPRCGAASAVH
jgi:hypothetical protein